MSFFYQNVQKMLALPENRRKNISIIHFDIPNFKLFNERNGFRLGDELLCDIAKTIKNEFNSAVVARFSNDIICVTQQLAECLLISLTKIFQILLFVFLLII